MADKVLRALTIALAVDGKEVNKWIVPAETVKR